MDSVDGCCGPRKPDGFQNAQAGSNPKKVDLIIWEIEVPKVRAAGLKCPQAWGHQACWGGGGFRRRHRKPRSCPVREPEAGGQGVLNFAKVQRAPLPKTIPPAPLRRVLLKAPAGLPSSGAFFFFFLWCSDLFGDAGKTWLRIGAGQAFPHCSAHAHQHRVCLIIEHSINPCGRELEKYSDV